MSIVCGPSFYTGKQERNEHRDQPTTAATYHDVSRRITTYHDITTSHDITTYHGIEEPSLKECMTGVQRESYKESNEGRRAETKRKQGCINNTGAKME
jgi:hypothetical protein